MSTSAIISFFTRTFFAFRNASIGSCSSLLIEVKVYSGALLVMTLISNVRTAEAPMPEPTREKTT
jgi:hypothetical protein